MYDHSFNNDPPHLACLLLKLTTPSSFKDYLLGDLHEEFDERAGINLTKAKVWYWKQAMNSTIGFFKVLLTSIKLLNLCVVIMIPVIFFLLLMTITGISNMDEADPITLSYILKGQVHNLLLNSTILINGYGKFISALSLDDYSSPSSLYWSLLSFSTIYLVNRKTKTSLHTTVFLAWALMLTPYFLGLLYIAVIQPESTKIGGIMALMVFPIIYMIFPLFAWFNSERHKVSST